VKHIRNKGADDLFTKTLASIQPARRSRQIWLLALAFVFCVTSLHAQEPLPSWNDGPAKQAVVDFVRKVTAQGGPDYVKPEARIAVFDNDGTLWTEWPVYTQLQFTLDRVKALAPKHPEWRRKQPYRAALTGDVKTLAAAGAKDFMEIVAATHAGLTQEEFHAQVEEWLAKAQHGAFKTRYESLVYRPMLELLAFLRANQFKTYIVTGGGVEFVRAFAERAYGVPPEQVVGSTIETRFERADGKPVLRRKPKIAFIDDKEGKPVAIDTHIGRRPIAAFGNSDGDYEMLEWTTAGPGARLGMIVRHDDAAREASYDRATPVGRLDKALDAAEAHRWTVISMKKDWRTIFVAPATAPNP
jgi:phosphoserine phosphatase